MSYLEENQSYMTEVGGYFYTSDKKLVWRGEHGKKKILSGHCIKEKGMRPFPHRCFAHWPESSGVTGNGVTDSAEARPTEDCVRLSSGC